MQKQLFSIFLRVMTGLTLLMGTLVACNPTSTQTPVVTASPYPSPDVVEQPVPTVPIYPEPTGTAPTQPPVGQPTPRVEMQASDLAGVNLASGQLQLVEFFAYW